MVKTSDRNELLENVNVSAIILRNYIIMLNIMLYPYHAKSFGEKLERLYNKPVKYVFLRHSHGDHVLGAVAVNDLIIMDSIPLLSVIKEKQQNQWTLKALKQWRWMN